MARSKLNLKNFKLYSGVNSGSSDISKLYLSAFAILFAGIGIYTLMPSKAATKTEGTTQACAAGGKVGDYNNDSVVNILDLSIFLSSYNKHLAKESNQMCDLNNDGNINISDLSILVSNYGK